MESSATRSPDSPGSRSRSQPPQLPSCVPGRFSSRTHKHNPREAPPAGSAQPSECRGAAQAADGRELRAGLRRPAPLRSTGCRGRSAAGRALRLPVGAWRPGGLAAGRSGQPSWAAALGMPRDGGGSRRESLSAERGRSAGRVPAEKSVTVTSSALFSPERKAQ